MYIYGRSDEGGEDGDGREWSLPAGLSYADDLVLRSESEEDPEDDDGTFS